MKKSILAIIIVFVVILTTLGVLYYTSYPIIGIGKMVGVTSDNFDKEFHSESISVWSTGATFLPDSPQQKQKMDDIYEWNNPIALELAEYRKEGGLAYNIKVSGEMEDGKTTLRYEGYIITKDGKRIDYKEEKTFDFILCSENRFFTEKL